jgi:hypothetical protein
MNISKLRIKLEIPLSWMTPRVLKLTQHYLKSKLNKIFLNLVSKNKTLKISSSERIWELNKQ